MKISPKIDIGSLQHEAYSMLKQRLSKLIMLAQAEKMRTWNLLSLKAGEDMACNAHLNVSLGLYLANSR